MMMEGFAMEWACTMQAVGSMRRSCAAIHYATPHYRLGPSSRPSGPEFGFTYFIIGLAL